MKKRLLTFWIIASMFISLLGQTPIVAVAEGNDAQLINAPEIPIVSQETVDNLPLNMPTREETTTADAPETVQIEDTTVENPDIQTLQDEAIGTNNSEVPAEENDASTEGLEDAVVTTEVLSDDSVATSEGSGDDSAETLSENISDNVAEATLLSSDIIASDGNTYEINVTYNKQSGIPMDGTFLMVSELQEGDDGYEDYIEESASKVGTKTEDFEFSKVFDIKIVDENDINKVYEPIGDVDVSIRVIGVSLSNYSQVNVLHFVEDSNDESFLVYDVNSTVNGETVEFSTDSFSVYVIVGYIETTIACSDGNTYKVTVSYDSNSGIPAGAELVVTEVSESDYASYFASAANVLNRDLSELSYGRLFDISIVKDGISYQPNDYVNVSVELMDLEVSEKNDLKVVHFDDDNHAQTIDATTENGNVTFETNGFSVFSFLDFGIDFIQTSLTAILGEKTGVLYENDYISLSGKMPSTGIVEANRVDVNIDGQDSLVAYDIKIYSGPLTKLLGINWQPSEESVQVTLKSDALDVDKVDVYHMNTVSSEPELVGGNVVVEKNSVTFDAESFSVYALTPETYHRTYRFFTLDENRKYVEYKLFTDQGTTTYTQIIKNGDSLIVPQLPSIQGSEASTFAGWFEGTGDVSNQPIDSSDITLSSTEFDFDNIPPITGPNEDEVHLFAKFTNFDYVIFHDQYNGSTGTFPVAMTRRGEKNNGVSTVQISDVTVAYDDSSDENTATQMAFYGWSYTKVSTAGSSVDDNNNPISKIPTDSIQIAENQGPVHLYPIFLPINWISYYSGPTGSGASYIPSKYYYLDEGPTSLSVPVRSGYSFLGWWAGSVDDNDQITYGEQISNPDGSLIPNVNDTTYGAKVEGGTLLLSKDVELIAKWQAEPIQYTVLYWQQNPNDDGYSLAEFETRHGTSGTLTNVVNDKNYEYFHFSEDQDKSTDGNQSGIVQQTINGSGNTAVNVYYDRNVYKVWLMVGLNGNNGYYYIKTTGSQIESINDIYNARNNNTANTGWERFTSSTNPFVSDNNEYTIETEQRNGNTYYYIAITARYGESLEGKWPTNGLGHQVNNRNFNSWQMTRYTYLRDITNNGTKTIKGLFPVMSEDIIKYNNLCTSIDETGSYFPAGVSNILVGCHPTNTSYSYTYRYYLWNPGTEQYPTDPLTVATSATSAASSATVASFEGYDYVRQTYGENGTGSGNTYGGIVNFYYMPEQYTLTFMYNGSTLGEDTYYYTQSLANADKYRTAAENAAPLGYSFIGWFENPNGAGEPFDFSSSTMPTKNIVLYPAYETIWYLIKIDPNGGSGLDSAQKGSTWFWEPYSGDPIQEYTWVTRDYVESRDGTFYYVKHDRDYYGYSDDYVSGEAGERSVYYTENPGEATDFTTYKKAENAYRYAGWYEVLYDSQGNEIGEQLYSFGDPVTHNTTLRLHWKKIGTYYVSYDAGVGSIDTGDSNETLFLELDGDDYADNAEVVVSRTAIAPEGYNFVGWTIRGDTSGRVYYPGQTFVFKAKDAVTVNGKDTIFMDAVYTRVKSATIIYDANGGTIDESALDYGDPTDPNAPAPSKSCDVANGTATIGYLINNSEIRLSSGAGFSNGNATLAGWSIKPNYNPNTDTLYDLNTAYYVDIEEPYTLYAVWKVKVYFHLNEQTSNANFGGTWDSTVYTLEAEDLYSAEVYLNDSADKPALDPVFYNANNPDNLFFHYWGTMRYAGDNIEEYDFSKPVTDKLHLYAYWAGPIKVPVHAVDASSVTLVDMDNTWLTTQPQTMIEVVATDVSLATKTDAGVYAANVPSEYEYAFAAIKSRTADLQTISEDDAITALYYNSTAKKVYVRFKDTGRADGPLADEDEVYLVYFEEPLALNIGYKVMSTTGALSNATMGHTGYPTTAPTGTYVMDSAVTRPLYWANQNTYKYYAYAIGTPDATTASQLQLITNSSDSDNGRPSLQITNTWRGLKYSTNGGNTWINCGYNSDIQLYVVYFETQSQPSVVTINEKTIGMASDMSEEFEYTVSIVNTETTVITQERRTRTRRNGNANWGAWSNYSSYGNPTSDSVTTTNSTTFTLSDGMQQTETLFYSSTSTSSEGTPTTNGNTQTQIKTTTTITTTQTITVTQTAKTGFVTDNTSTAGTRTDEYIWTYTTTATPATPLVTYTNTHTPLTVEVHVALMGGGGITLDDDERAASHTITLPIDRPTDAANTKEFLTELPAATLFTGDSTVYGFAGIVYGTSGTNQGDEVTVVGTDVNSIAYEQMYPNDANRDNIYEATLKDGSSNVLDQLGNNNIYYLYYPLPKVVYVKESSGGVLERIQGSTDGSTVTNNITYNGSALTLNGVIVAQEQLLPVTKAVFTISQTVETGNYNIPPKLDEGTEKLFLNYTKVGIAGTANVANSHDLYAVNENQTIYLRVMDNQAKWSLDGSTWNAFTDSEPTVYAIYKEIGYDLEITKTFTGLGIDSAMQFTLTISSNAITESSYSVQGTGYNTVSATPATASTPGTITLTITDGSDIIIHGLSRGDYTLTESEGAVMSAKIGDVNQTVTNNSMTITDLHANTKVDITNRFVKLIAPTDYNSIFIPFLWILGIGGILTALGIIAFFMRKKNRLF